MQRMLDTAKQKAGQDETTDGVDDTSAFCGGAGYWSFAIRLGLAVASVCAAYFIMTSAWPAEYAVEALGRVATGSLPGQLGQVIASLR